MAKSKIEWTEATWNPIVGCSLASPGCTNCYAMRQAHRMASNPATPQYHGTTKVVNGKPVFTGKVSLAEKVLLQPLKRRKPTTYFVNSMGDLFHEDVPDDWIDHAFAVMALCPQHTFQVLTKRSGRMREYVAAQRSINGVGEGIRTLAVQSRNDWRGFNSVGEAFSAHTGRDMRTPWWPLPNVWIGVSVEDQRRADERIPDLLATPAAIRFLSCEPLLGPVNLLVTDQRGHDITALRGIGVDPTDPDGPDEYYRTEKIDWVIAGGESGSGARPMHPDWARSLRDQCAAARVPFLFKQWGDWLCSGQADRSKLKRLPTDEETMWLRDDGLIAEAPISATVPGALGGGEKQIIHGEEVIIYPKRKWLPVAKVGKKAAGRAIDGVIHDGFPEAA